MASEHPAGETDPSNKCPVCTDGIEEPQSLPCGHEMCEQCLTQQVSASASADKSFPCPTCGKKWKVSDGGVIEKAQPQQKTIAIDDTVVQVPFCVKGEHGPATAFCMDCSKFFCEDCISTHQQCEWMSDHRLEPVADMSSDDIKYAKSAGTRKTCPEHDLPLSILCMTCKEVICFTCLRYKHKDHAGQELVQSATEAKAGMDRMTDEANTVIKRRDDDLRGTEQTKETIHNDVKRAKDSVKEAAQRTLDTIRKHEEDLLADLDRYEEEAIQILERIKHNVETCKAGMVHLQEEISGLQKFGNPIEQVERTFVLQEKLDAQQKKEAGRMTWKYTCEETGPSEESVKSMLGSVELVTPKITLGRPLQQSLLSYVGKYLMAGMVVVGDCLCAVFPKDPHIWFYDMTHSKNNTCVVPHLEDPQGMALVNPSDRTVVITDQNAAGGMLHYVKISRNLSISFLGSKTLLLENPCNVNVSLDNSELLIGQWGKAEFLVCDLQGNTQRQVTVTSPDGIERFPLRVQQTASGYAAVMLDKKFNSIIQLLGEDGAFISCYGDRDGEHLNCGKHVATDNGGQLIVAEYENKRLHLLDNKGQLVQLLLEGDDCMLGPECIILDEAAGRLYVAFTHTASSSQVNVYEWQPLSGEFRLELTVPHF